MRHADLADERALAGVRDHAEARGAAKAALFLVERSAERARVAKRAVLRHDPVETGRRLRVLLTRCVARRGGTLEVGPVVVEEDVRKDLAAEAGAYLRLL
jgi:hypothetical protein